MLALGHETVCFVSLGLGALVLSLRIFFVKNLLSSWWMGVDVALALILARLLLRGCCPLVPRNLLPVLCGGGAGPGLTRSCSPGHITASDLETGPWALLPRPSPAIRLLPLGWPVGGSCMSPCFEMLSVLFPGNIGSHFLGISHSFFGNVCFLLFLMLLASSCPGSYGREGGSAGLCLHPPASVAPDPQRLSGSPH